VSRSGINGSSLNSHINSSLKNSANGKSRPLRSVAEGRNEEDGNGSEEEDANSWNVGDKEIDATASQSKDSVNFKSSNLVNAAAK
jgi:hypothetical protein